MRWFDFIAGSARKPRAPGYSRGGGRSGRGAVFLVLLAGLQLFQLQRPGDGESLSALLRREQLVRRGMQRLRTLSGKNLNDAGGGGGGLEVQGPRVVTKTIAVRFFASGPSKEPLPLLQSLFTTCPGRTGLYAYSLFPCIPGNDAQRQNSYLYI